MVFLFDFQLYLTSAMNLIEPERLTLTPKPFRLLSLTKYGLSTGFSFESNVGVIETCDISCASPGRPAVDLQYKNNKIVKKRTGLSP